ncbi:protein-glutamine gamma-glutamyltransferase [Clostridium estertheticum]|uniref:protein-glutamine gamma-glutamyltransferase n=1 Tax=Clostridium estertheticum TaxID=238834 RepID=UPI001CF48E37|nr:protein-glutamine gamma-glutamyltransferase [Clostridium estertheticum]MCB2352938.1 protein-glutamine gamma-glutamyltransferase [Clostridium estertheticum]WAG40241.1 protein-glutamine gamma-glutamyltransferase [Clostridium estertheticum]
MIIISGSVVNVNTFIHDYNPNDIEKDIITKMDLSKSQYKYDSLNQFKFELDFRYSIVIAAKNLNKGNMDFRTFRKSICNPNYWDRTNEGGFILKKGVAPSDAIKDISINSSKYGTECATAMVIIYYQALLNIFSANLFNRLFPNIQLMNWHYIDNLLEDVGFIKKRSDYFPGDRRYFYNPDVDPVAPEWQGENVIDLSNGLYYGHGIGIGDADEIISELNKFRIKEATTSSYLLDSAARPNFKSLADIK